MPLAIGRSNPQNMLRRSTASPLIGDRFAIRSSPAHKETT
jgi:hypothetical protein